MIPGLPSQFELNICVCGEAPADPQYMFCQPCGNLLAKRRSRDVKHIVFSRMGWECACCGKVDHPSSDHVDGQGKKHREEDPSARHLQQWLIDHDFPDGFQTLCRSCNSSKQDGPVCWRHRKYLGPDFNRRGTSIDPAPVINVNISVTVNLTDWGALLA